MTRALCQAQGMRAPEPRPPLASRDLPPEKRREFWEVRHALFDLGRLTGDEADLWAWRIVMDRKP